MKKSLEVPFYPSVPTSAHPEGEDCVEMSIKMILGYLMPEKNFTTNELEKITGKQPGKGSWEMPFSIWFVNNGLSIKHYTTFDYVRFQNEGIEYIRAAYGNEVAEWQQDNTDVETARKQTPKYIEKVEIINRIPTIEDIVREMKDGHIVRAMIDGGYINDEDEYLGHSVVVIGYDDDSIWFHDPGMPPLENRSVSKKKFQEAMDRYGGEIDAIKKAS